MTSTEKKFDFGKARLRSIDRKSGFPYLAAALFSMVSVPTDRVPTAATDEYWRLYWNPEFFEKLTPDQGAMVLVHEVWHQLLFHFERRRKLNVPPQDSTIWGLAIDMEINCKDSLPRRLPQDAIFAESYGLEPNLTAEQYYELLREMRDELEELNPSLMCGDCGSCSGTGDRPWELPPPGTPGAPSGVDPARTKLIAQATAKAIKDGAGRGSTPANWVRWAEATLTPKVNWREELTTCMQSFITSVMGNTFPDWKRPSRRQHLAPDLPQPSRRDVLPRIKIIIDTSGSMVEKDLNAACTEVNGALNALGRSAVIEVFSVDAAVHSAKKIMTATKLELVGGGGTDMRIGIEEVQRRHREDPHDGTDLLVVVTDGDTPWPQENVTEFRVIVLITRKNSYGPHWCRPPQHRSISIHPA